MKSSKIIEDQINTYKDNFLQNKDSSLGTFQNNRETQYLRFEHIIKQFKNILNKDVSFHDFGCGVCDMHEYLNQQGIEHDYSGTEVIQEMIDHAKEKFPGIKLYNRDVLVEEVKDKYDFVVFSGGLYFPGSVPKNEWEIFVYKIIEKMFDMATIGISFNLLTSYSTFQDDHLFYVDPKIMFDYCCNNLSRFAILDQAYPLYEWTITVFKKEYMQKKYNHPAFQKYLKI